MKIPLPIFIYLFSGIYCVKSSVNFTQYLNEQAKSVTETLIRLVRTQKNLYTLKFNDVNTMDLDGNYSSVEIFTLFNTAYALLDRELYQISENNYTRVHNFGTKERVRFCKSTQFRNLGFLAVATSAHILHVFGFSSETREFFKIQNILHVNITDVSFFAHRNDLYLITSNYKTADLTSFILYKFLSTYFDEEESFWTSGATKLYTFESSESQIIVILQKYGPTSSVYEFKQNRIRKIQKIDTKLPVDVTSYRHQEKYYLMIFSEISVSPGTAVTNYLWTGFELILWEKYTIPQTLRGPTFQFYNGTRYLLTSDHSFNLLIYSLTEERISLIGEYFIDTTNKTDLWTYNFLNYTNTLIIVDDNVKIKTLSISVQNNPQEKYQEEEKLSTCFTNLEKAVYILRNKLRVLESSNSSRLRSAHDSKNHLRPKSLEGLQEKHSLSEDARINSTSQNLIFNTSVTISFPIKAKKVIAKDIRLEKINNKRWEPEHWLSYSVPQKISGPVKAQIVQVDDLETNNNPLFDNLLLLKGDQIISGSVKVKNLETKLVLTEDNNSFTNHVHEFSLNLTINNLEVENINEVNFDKFKNSLFRIGHGHAIDGNITFANVEAEKMIFETVTRKRNFLTASTDQTINSSFTISKMFAGNITAGEINGIDFKNSAATLNDSVIEGPVSIKNLTVGNNLELKGDINKEFLQFNDTHIVGTNESDFLQIYNGKVKIRGNLFLKNLDLGKQAEMFVSGEKFSPKIDQFWTKTTKQAIPTHFEARNGITVPHLFASFINDVSVNDYMLNSTEQKKSAKFYFDHVTIKGSVLLNPDEQHSPDLQRIQRDSVKVNGTFRIRGHVTYNKTLKVDRLEVGRLKSDRIAEENALASFSESKSIKKIIIRGDLIAKNLSTETVNGVKLKELVENAVFVNKAQNISKLNFENVTAKNLLIISKLNQYEINKLMSKYQTIENTEKIKDVYIDNVTIRNIRNLLTINNKSVNDLLQANPFKARNRTISGNTKFAGNVSVKNFQVVVVNDMNLRDLSLRVLYKYWNQNITEPFIFSKLTTENFITGEINDYDVQNLVDVSVTEPQEIFAADGLIMNDPVKVQNLNGLFECDLGDSLKELKNPSTKVWGNVVVTGNVTFWDGEALVSSVLSQAVNRHSKNQVVRGKVTFVDYISANNITAKKSINSVNLDEIVRDAFLNKPDAEQIITGKKVFTRVEAETLECLQNIKVSKFKDYDISEINDKIISKNSLLDVPIKGKKVFFGGLQTKRIETDMILGVEPKNLVSFEDVNKDVPKAIFESVTVDENFNIEFINGMPFKTLMNERLLKNSPNKQILTGDYFFQNIYFDGNISSPRINDIDMENLVYDSGTQNITSPKRFLNTLRVIGDVKTDLINGLKISEAYEKAVLKKEDTNFTGSLIIIKPALIEGNIEAKYINNVSFDYIMETNANYSLQTEAQQIHHLTKTIASFIKRYLNTTLRMPTELLYIEKSANLQITLPDTISAHISETKDDVLIHIASEEDGTFCGLPQTCKCPVQQTVQISSGHSVNTFINKAMQRIYTYFDDHITVHFITHSVSKNSTCRTNATKILNELSSIAWNTPPKGNDTGRFSVHRTFLSGYISDVKFFTVFGRTYVVVGVYYDPVLDTHNVSSLVLRFNEDQTALEEIQKIPTTGIKTISLIPTAQGVVLIIGNEVSDQFSNTTTKIFRFSHETEQFELLRELPAFRTLLAEGVVLEMDSLLVLANEQSTLQILKYQKEFDNYYFYQSFQMDYAISSVSVFYAQGFGISDSYLSVVTTNNKYFIYSFQFIEGWKLEFSGEYDGIKNLIPFKLNNRSYLFASASKGTSLLTLVEHDST